MSDVECPRCKRVWPHECEQADNIRSAGECIVCDVDKQRQLILAAHKQMVASDG